MSRDVSILRNTILGKAIFFILLFIQYYPVIPKGVGVSTRILSSLLGAWLLFIHLVKKVDKERTFFLLKKIIYLLIPFLCMVLTSYTTMFLNSTTDSYFAKYISTPLVMLLAAYGTITIAREVWGDEKITFKFIAYCCIGVVFFQDILSVFMYTIPSLKDKLYSLILLDPIENALFGSEGDTGGRLMGFGANFMNLGVANSVASLLIMILVKNAKKYAIEMKAVLFLAFIFIYIFAIGLMQARTTVVGTALGIAYLFISSFKLDLTSFIKSIVSLFRLGVLVIILAWIVFSILPDTVQKNQSLINYGFEMFISLKNKGTLQTGSGDVLKTMYKYPETIQGWVIGEGHFVGLNGGGFYKNTDIGWIRLIFYFGVIGAVFYYLYEVMIIYQTFRPEEKRSKFLIIYFVALIFIIHCKSFTEITTYIALFWVYNITLRPKHEQKAAEMVQSGASEEESQALLV